MPYTKKKYLEYIIGPVPNSGIKFFFSDIEAVQSQTPGLHAFELKMAKVKNNPTPPPGYPLAPGDKLAIMVGLDKDDNLIDGDGDKNFVVCGCPPGDEPGYIGD